MSKFDFKFCLKNEFWKTSKKTTISVLFKNKLGNLKSILTKSYPHEYIFLSTNE